jgi:hypothetical protein
MRKLSRIAPLGVSSFLLITPAVFGQTGSVSGTILTADGGPVQNAIVAAKNSATGASVTTKSGEKGDYNLALPPGRYELSAELPPFFIPFKQADVAVQAGKPTRIDIQFHDRNLDTLGDGGSFYAFLSSDHPAPTGPAPRTDDGKPDLTGLWLPRVPDSVGPPPELLPPAQKIVRERQQNFAKDLPNAQCLPLGPSFSGFFAPYQLVQTAAMMVIMEENGDPSRRIYLDGRKHPSEVNPSFMGHSVGRWEGDTLVVETVGFNDRGWVTLAGYPQTETLRITEKFRRLDLGHLEVETTFEDPATFKKPWTNKRVSALAPKDMEMLEYVCAENNRDIGHMVGK